MRVTAGTVAGIILGAIGSRLTRRYLPAFLWWIFTTDTRRRPMARIHHTREYQACVREMKARARFQKCITCPRILDATKRRGHPQHMTLGHIHDVDSGGAPYDPRNYGPQCEPCNAAGGAHITNQKRRGVHRTELITSPDWS